MLWKYSQNQGDEILENAAEDILCKMSEQCLKMYQLYEISEICELGMV